MVDGKCEGECDYRIVEGHISDVVILYGMVVLMMMIILIMSFQVMVTFWVLNNYIERRQTLTRSHMNTINFNKLIS